MPEATTLPNGNAEAAIQPNPADDLRNAVAESDWFNKMVSGDPAESKEEQDPEKPKDESAADGDGGDKSKGEPAKPAEKAKPEKKPKKAEAEAKTPEEPAPSDGEGEEPAKKPAKRKPAAPRAAPPTRVDQDRIAEVAATAAVRAVQTAQVAPKPGDQDDLTPEVKRRIDVYAELERMDPKRYSGIAKKLSDFQKAELKRAEQWEASHPGERYDSESEEHSDWYARNEVNVDREDFEDARIRVAASKLVDERYKPEIERARTEARKIAIEPKAKMAANHVTASVLSAVTDKPLTEEEYTRLREEDPEALEIATEIDKAYRPIGEAIPLLWGGVVPFDNRRYEHKSALEMLKKFEAEIAENDDIQIRDGKQWLPLSQFERIPEDQRRDYWAINEEDLVKYVAVTAASEAKERHEKVLKRLEKMAEKRGWVRKDATKTPPAGNERKPSTEAKGAEKTAQSRSPSIGVSPVAGNAGKPSELDDNSPLSPLWKRIGI